MKKLHLGCGQIYLNGYTNVDYPIKNHSVQNKSVADVHADITNIRFGKNKIKEVRLHHVFEHFPRAQAIALVLSWRSWLNDGGLLRIEVPNFNRCALEILNPFNGKNKKNIALRHIFGSQEQFWANHYDGYSMERIENLLSLCGFDKVDNRYSSYKGTYNIEIIVSKNKKKITKADSVEIAKKYLSKYLVDNSETEKKLLKIWMNEFNKQIKKTWAK